ncbi:MAG TPA: cell division protein FtsA [Patescibacteria group bacterium]|nr:cell division protein FtsA [Patescibacteria group bacterium]
MAKERIIAGIDIGSSKIVTLIAQLPKESGQVTVIGVSSMPARGIKKGQVVDIDESVSALASGLESAERMAGYSVSSAYISVGGSQIASMNSRGVVAVSGPDGEITDEDIRRVTEAARAISIPSSREIIHVVPRGFIVDSQEGVKDPIGMSGVRLEVETHIISGAATSLRNLSKIVNQIGVEVEDLVFSGLASAESTLTDTEKELGVALVDIGGGTTDVSLFVDGSIAHSVVLPIGGKNITNDLAIGLRVSLDTAEKIKIALGRQHKKIISPETSNQTAEEKKREDELDTSKLGLDEELATISRKTLTDGIIKPRLMELATLIGMEIKKSGYGSLLPSGLVVTGGAAETVGLTEVFKDILRMPTRVAFPTGATGLIDEISTPAYSAAIGLLLYGLRAEAFKQGGLGMPMISGFKVKGTAGKLGGWLRSFMP